MFETAKRGGIDVEEKIVLETAIELEDTQKNRFLTFDLDNESYGIEIQYVTEIIGIQPVTEVPELPQYIKGIINLRGKVIPVMDVRLKFKKAYREYNDRTCVIVIDIREISIGLIVDGVSEVLFIPESEIVDPPEMCRDLNKFMSGIGKVGDKVKLLLDCNELLNKNDMINMSNI